MTPSVKPPCDEAQIRARSAAAPCSPATGPWVLAATILGSSMAFIDGTVVNVALPALQRDLGATVVEVLATRQFQDGGDGKGSQTTRA
jgi:hypothetical protein